MLSQNHHIMREVELHLCCIIFATILLGTNQAAESNNFTISYKTARMVTVNLFGAETSLKNNIFPSVTPEYSRYCHQRFSKNLDLIDIRGVNLEKYFRH